MQAMEYREYCGKCASGLPPDYVAPESPEPYYSPSPSPDPDYSPDNSSPAPDTSGLDSCTATIEYDVDLLGGDLSSDSVQDVESAGECCQLCNDRSDCYAW